MASGGVVSEETAGPGSVNSDGEIRKSNLYVLIQATINFPFPCLGLWVVDGAAVATTLVRSSLVFGRNEEITEVVLISLRGRQRTTKNERKWRMWNLSLAQCEQRNGNRIKIRITELTQMIVLFRTHVQNYRRRRPGGVVAHNSCN